MICSQFRFLTETEAPLKAICLISFAALLVLGCTHTIALTPDSEPYDYNRANARMEHWKGTATMRDGDRYRGQDFRVQPDSVAWHAPAAEMMDIMRGMGITAEYPTWSVRPISAVSEIRVKDRGRGSVQGVVAGFVAGFIQFAIIANNEDDGTFLSSDHDFEVFLPAMIGSTALGSLIGASIGSKSVITFNWPASTLPSTNDQR